MTLLEHEKILSPHQQQPRTAGKLKISTLKSRSFILQGSYTKCFYSALAFFLIQ